MKIAVTVALVFCLSAAAFASGEDQIEGSYPGKKGVEDFEKEMSEPQTYTGIFKMEEGAYPAILTVDGELYYLMLPGMIVGGDLPPSEGAALSIEAFKAPFSPVHLMIVSAEVDGEEIDMRQFGKKSGLPWGIPGCPGGYGPWGRGRGRHQGYGKGGYGPWGMPRWDYPEN